MLAVAEERTWFRRASCLDFPCAIANQLAEVWGERIETGVSFFS